MWVRGVKEGRKREGEGERKTLFAARGKVVLLAFYSRERRVAMGFCSGRSTYLYAAARLFAAGFCALLRRCFLFWSTGELLCLAEIFFFFFFFLEVSGRWERRFRDDGVYFRNELCGCRLVQFCLDTCILEQRCIYMRLILFIAEA